MKTSTINLAIPDQLLRQADEVAKRESRNRSELMRQALRMYLERRKNWDRLFAYADAHVARLELKPADVADAVHEARQR